MIALDTNVLVRYVVMDDPVQRKKTFRLLKMAFSQNEKVFIRLVVLCEMIWVLERSYKVERQDIEGVLATLLENSRYEIQEATVAKAAFKNWLARKGDFTDLLIGRLAEGVGCLTTYTFDRKLARSPGFSLL